LSRYEAEAEAYVAGPEKLAEACGGVGVVVSMASFSVSWMDIAVIRALEES
jgi:hypothetical protein